MFHKIGIKNKNDNPSNVFDPHNQKLTMLWSQLVELVELWDLLGAISMWIIFMLLGDKYKGIYEEDIWKYINNLLPGARDNLT